MGNHFEIKHEAVQLDKLQYAPDLQSLQKELQTQKDQLKERLKMQQTVNAANKFLGDTEIKLDLDNCRLQVGDKYLNFPDEATLRQQVVQIERDITAANKEIADYYDGLQAVNAKATAAETEKLKSTVTPPAAPTATPTDATGDVPAKTEAKAKDGSKPTASTATTAVDQKKTNANAPKETEKVVEKTKEEKIAEAEKLIAGLGLVVTTEKTAKGSEKVVNLTQEQYEKLQKITLVYSEMNASYASSNGVGNTVGGFSIENRADQQKLRGKYDRQIDKIQNLIDKGRTRKAEKLTERLYNKAQNGAEINRQLDAFSRGFANEQAKETYHSRIAQNALGLSKGGEYTGMTVAVEPFHPLFTNICQSINQVGIAGVVPMNVAGERVMLRSPDYVSGRGFAAAFDQNINYTQTADRNPNSYGNQAADWLSKHTNIAPQDAKKAINTVGLVAGGAAVVGALGWLFTGKNIFSSKDGKFDLSKKMEESILRRIAGVAVGAAGLNFASKMANGRSFLDNVKDTYNGKMKWSEWIKNKNPMETATNGYSYAGSVLNGIDQGTIGASLEPRTDGKIRINAQQLYNYVSLKAQTATGAEKAKRERKKLAIAALVNDKAAQQYVNEALSGWTTYDALKDGANKDKTLDASIARTTTRTNLLTTYMTSHGLSYAPGKTKEVTEYIISTDDAVTPETLEKAGVIVKTGNVAISTTDGAKNAATDTIPENMKGLQELVGKNGYTVENLTKLHEASQTINGEHAGKVGFEIGTDDGILYVRYNNSWNIPLIINDGCYQIANFNHQFPIDKASEALNVAAITGFLIVNNRGKALPEVKDHYTVGRDNIVGRTVEKMTGHEGDLNFNDGVKNNSVLDGEDRWSSTAAEKGGDVFQSRMKTYAIWLNGLKSTSSGKSIWEQNSNVTNWKDMSYMSEVKTQVTKTNAQTQKNTTTGTATGAGVATGTAVATGSGKTETTTTTKTETVTKTKEKKTVETKRTPEDAKKELEKLNDSITQTPAIPAERGKIIDKTAKLLNEVFPNLDMRIEKHNGYIIVHSHGEQTKIDTVKHRVTDTLATEKPAGYGAGDLLYTPDRWRDLIRTACLTNWVKQNFRHASDNDKPFELSGTDIQFDGKGFWDAIGDSQWRRLFFDVDVVDGEDNMSSTQKIVGGTAFQSHHETYKNWLNTMQNATGQSIWRRGVDDVRLPEGATKEYIETAAYVGQVRDSFNAMSNTDGVGEEGLQIEKISLGNALVKGDGARAGYPVEVKYEGRPLMATAHMYINPDTGEMAYKSSHGDMRILKYAFSKSAKKDMLALAVLTDSAIQRYPNRGQDEAPANVGVGGDIEMDTKNVRLDEEVIESSDIDGYCNRLKSNKQLYADYLNYIGAFQRDQVVASMTKSSTSDPHRAQRNKAGSF